MDNRFQRMISGIVSVIKFRNFEKLLFFVPIFTIYWALFPVLFSKLGLPYLFISPLFVLIAAFLWGVKGCFLLMATSVAIRLVMSQYLKIELYGGLFTPILVLSATLIVGVLSDYISTVERHFSQLSENIPREADRFDSRKMPHSAVFEIILLTLSALAIGIIASYLDLFEFIFRFSRELEVYDIDEIIIVAGLLVVFIGIFSYRRWQDLRKELYQRLKTEAALMESEKKYRTIIDNAFEGICIFQASMTRFVNPHMIRTMGYEEKELLNRPFLDFVHPDDQTLVSRRYFNQARGQDTPGNLVFRILSKDQKTIWMRVTSQPIIWNNQAGVLVFLRDETDILAAQELLKNTLKEKDTLLREVHHRVKNNMQVIISLLNLQSAEVANEELKQAFAEAQTRVRAMSLAHEIIYQTESLSAIDLSSYIGTLCRNLVATHNPPGRQVQLFIDIPGLHIELSQAVPCGLLVNELVTNSLKHGFSNQHRGRIDITGQTSGSGHLELTIADNGSGLPEGVDWQASKTLGLKMVRILAEVQLKGELEYHYRRGARFIVRFRIKEKQEVENGTKGHQNTDH